ncbi:MAG: cysteine desulfurase family protein, partial [Candidatus Dormibacteria bacterium]
MAPALLGTFANPSSVHAPGRAARALVDEARDRLAEALHCRPREVVFTGGGSEADNLALRGVAAAAQAPGHLVVSAVEHEAVLETARHLEGRGWALTVLPVDGTGRVEPRSLEEALRPDTRMVSVMLANNEVGTIQPVAELAELVHARSSAVFHSDATQALGKVAIDVDALGVDLLTVSAHKVYGPKGVGALYVRQGVAIEAEITGGGQERTRRSGTENVAGIVGFAVAAEMAERERPAEVPRQRALTEELGRLILDQLPQARATGAPSGDGRLPNFCTFAFPGAEGELLLLRLDRAGVYGSAGSACASGSLAPSHVLLAMGLPPDLAGAHL